jgi:hypothetical protein
MVMAVSAIVIGAIFIIADVLFLIKNYLISFRGSNKSIRNVFVFILIIIIFISSAVTLGAGMDLKRVVTDLTQLSLSPTSRQQLLHISATLKFILSVTMTIQLVSSVFFVLLIRKIEKERKELLSKPRKSWDLNKLKS